jgi:group I intron endonuclease
MNDNNDIKDINDIGQPKTFKAFIYALVYDGQTLYTGSTYDMEQRLYRHKKDCHNNVAKYHYPLYQFIRTKSWDDIEMRILEECYVSTLQQLREREGYWQTLLKPKYNIQLAGRSRCQWFKDNKEHMQQYKREHKIPYEHRRDYKLEKVKCECGSMITRTNMSYHRKTARHKLLMKIE